MRLTSLVTNFTLLGVTVACGGCLPTVGVSADFDSALPQDRLAAVAEARRTGDLGAVAQLIEMLSSDDPLIRLVASDTLKRLTNEDFGYDPGAPDADRRAAAERWADWHAGTESAAEARADL